MLYYTDGSCFPNPGKGGWGFVAVRCSGEKEYECFSGTENTTNNRMEMMAIIRALEYSDFIHDPEPVIVSDSQLCINICSKWLFGWEKKGTIGKRKNQDLLHMVLPLLRKSNPAFMWVRGHSGDRWNEHADMLSCRHWKSRE